MSNLNTMQEIFNIAKDEGVELEDLNNEDWIVIHLSAIVKELQKANELSREAINNQLIMDGHGDRITHTFKEKI